MLENIKDLINSLIKGRLSDDDPVETDNELKKILIKGERSMKYMIYGNRH